MAGAIRDWLKQLGLEHYAAAFEDNDLDLALAADINDQDLKDLGVNSMGHRKILLRAIAALAATGEAAADAPADMEANGAADSGDAGLLTSAGSRVERRQLTVMFCDLVGSTALSTTVDPEDYRDLIRSYQEVCTRHVKRYDGYLAKYMGDGVLAYFGWPRGHEDDAELAVKAAFDIIDAVSGMTLAHAEQEHLAVRVGIATGAVLVGDIVGEGVAREAAVTGEIPNLAARLQGVAEPDTVIIDSTTRTLLGGLFEFTKLAPRSLKGFEGQVEAWRADGEVGGASRFEAVRGQYLTRYIGRRNELALLRERWELASKGEGQVVLLSGEAGIGKSRLTHELMTGIRDTVHQRQRLQCSPYHTNSALNPFIGYLERAARFSPADGEADKLTKLEALVQRIRAPSDEAVALLAGLLSVAYEARFGPLDLTPQKTKQRTLELLSDLTIGLADNKPILFLFEDAHWVDPTSQELLDLIVARADCLSVLLIITHRPEWQAPFSGHPNTTLLQLNRLGRQQIAQLVGTITTQTIPDDVVESIMERTDGVPLFIEEMT
ncbi:MAG: adenylate/guanylate cyclase domain-containing protein, partial [Alphaproteobacteria bacterium]